MSLWRNSGNNSEIRKNPNWNGLRTRWRLQKPDSASRCIFIANTTLTTLLLFHIWGQWDEETHPRIYFNNLGNFQSRPMLYANYKLAHVFKHVCLWEGEHGPAKSFYSILWPLKGILNSFKDILLFKLILFLSIKTKTSMKLEIDWEIHNYSPSARLSWFSSAHHSNPYFNVSDARVHI